MKTLIRFAVSLIAAITLFPVGALAQVDFNSPQYAKYGADAATREANYKNYSFFLEAFKMNSYGDAAKRLNDLIQACPEANENFYLYGIRMYRNQMDEAKTDEEVEKFQTEVLRMIDLRAEYFGTKNGKVLKYNYMADKVKELLRIETSWDKNKDIIFKTVEQIAKEGKNDLDISFYMIYFNNITDKFLNDKLSSEVVLAQYELISDGLSLSEDPAKVDVQRTIDGYLIGSGAATCENLVNLFKPQFEKDPNNLDLIKKIMRYLNAGNCEDDFKTHLAEKYYSLDPSADAAYSLACSFASKRDMPKAIRYFKEAVSRETNKALVSKYELRLAMTYLLAKNNESAASYARSAISSDPRNGYAQFILAQAYLLGADGATCTAPLDKKAIYWLVYGILEKARAITSKDAPEMQEIVKQMNLVKNHFPSMEDIFYHGSIKVGDKYTVNCGWIKGETKVYDPK